MHDPIQESCPIGRLVNRPLRDLTLNEMCWIAKELANIFMKAEYRRHGQPLDHTDPVLPSPRVLTVKGPGRRAPGLRRWALVGVGLGLAACTPTLDGELLSKSITSKFEGDGVAVNSVKCPPDRVQKKDDTFECQGVSSKGDTFTVRVTQTDDQGNVRWELDGKVFDPAAFSDRALRYFTNNRKVDCGREKFIAVKGSEMACAVEGGKSATLVFGEGGELDEEQVKRLIGGG